MMKNLIKTTLILLALLLPTTATAHDFEVDGIYYNINGNEATVTYKDSYNSAVYSGDISIPSTVTYNGTTYPVTLIGNYAFYVCTGLTSINIPNSVTSIGISAFYGCTGLTSINIPNSITSIVGGAFYGTAWYNNQPDGLVYAGLVAYHYKGTMPSGTSITLKEGTLGISDHAFEGCTGLTSINIGNSVTSIDEMTFFQCTGLTSINIGNSVTSIGDWAFEGCTGLTSIDIPNSVTSIGDWVFEGCTGLRSVNMGNSVTSIGWEAFQGCSGLISINIPNSVTSIDSWALDGTAWYDNQPDGLVYAGLVAYKYKGTMPSGISITLKEGSLGIAGQAFSGCTGLTSIYIPNSVTSIGGLAFSGCTGLTNINIGNSVTAIGGHAFYGCPNVTSIHCFAANPPACIEYEIPWVGDGVYSNFFDEYSATLHVPKASLSAYFTTPEWSYFENIVGDAVAPTGISISKDSMEIQLGEQFELAATVAPANASIKEVTWYSTDTDVATVEDGIITTVGYGECDIVATCFGMQAVCHVIVANRIMLDQNEVMLLPNHMLTLTPTMPIVPQGFTATSSDPTVAAVRVMNGKVQLVGVAEGTATITVGAADGTAIPATCLVTVYTEPGDVNMDGFTDIDDVTALISYVLGDGVDVFKAGNANLNGDNAIDIDDITSLISQILGN